MTIQPRKDQLRLNDADNLNVDSAAIINDVVVKSLVDLGILDLVASATEPASPSDYTLWYNTQFQDHQLLIWDPSAGGVDHGNWVTLTRELLLLAEEDLLGAQEASELLVNSDTLAHSDGVYAQEVFEDFDAVLTTLDTQERYVSDISLAGTTLSLTSNNRTVISEDLSSLSGGGFVFDIDSFPTGGDSWQAGMAFLVQDGSGTEQKHDLDLLVSSLLANGTQTNAAVANQAFVSIDTAIAGDPVPAATYLGSPMVHDIATGVIYTWVDTDADGVADAYQALAAGGEDSGANGGLLATIAADNTTGTYTKTADVTLSGTQGVQFDYTFSGPQTASNTLVGVAMYFDNVLVANPTGTAPYTETIGGGEDTTTVNHPAQNLSVDTDTFLGTTPAAGTYEVRVVFTAPHGAIVGNVRVFAI